MRVPRFMFHSAFSDLHSGTPVSGRSRYNRYLAMNISATMARQITNKVVCDTHRRNNKKMSRTMIHPVEFALR